MLVDFVRSNRGVGRLDSVALEFPPFNFKLAEPVWASEYPAVGRNSVYQPIWRSGVLPAGDLHARLLGEALRACGSYSRSFQENCFDEATSGEYIVA